MTDNSKQLKEYYDVVGNRTHARRTEAAEKLHTSKIQVAVDCGCGTGNDISYFLDKGYEVFGFDSNSAAVSICKKRFSAHKEVDIFQDTFEKFRYPSSSVVIAHSSLFFADPDRFDETWIKLSNSILPGGVFSGDFMGAEDDWAVGFNMPITLLSYEQVIALFNGYEIVSLKERNEEGHTASGKSKHWHTYSVVARKEV